LFSVHKIRSIAGCSGEVLWVVCILFFTFLATGYSAAQSSDPCHSKETFAKVDALIKAKSYTAARSRLNQLRDCPTLSPSSLFATGWLYGRTHDFATALKVFNSLPLTIPNEPTHRYAIALAEFELGNFAKSAEALEPMQGRQELESKSANLLGVSYSKLGKYDDAYKVLTENIARHSSDLFSYLNLITLLSDTGHFSEAAKVADQAVTAFPANSDVLVVRGATYTLTGDLEKAHSDFAAAVHLSSQDANERFLLALCEYRQGEYDKASSGLKKAIQSGIVDSDLHYLLAECLLKLDSTRQAQVIDELNRAIELNPKAVAARTLRGKLLLESGRPQAAMTDLVLAHRIDPRSRSAAYNLARAESKLGRSQQAKAIFEELQTQHGDSLSELSDQKLHKALSPDQSQ
jgi:tetratricopeptide (TPR) repeat protein